MKLGGHMPLHGYIVNCCNIFYMCGNFTCFCKLLPTSLAYLVLHLICGFQCSLKLTLATLMALVVVLEICLLQIGLFIRPQ